MNDEFKDIFTIQMEQKISFLNKRESFFETTVEDTLFYRMTHVDRSAWTFDNKIFENYNKGLADSKKYLDKLLKLLRENSIGINFVLYPHPSQIYYKDLYH